MSFVFVLSGVPALRLICKCTVELWASSDMILLWPNVTINTAREPDQMPLRRFCLWSLWSHPNVLTFFPLTVGCSERWWSRSVQIFLWTHGDSYKSPNSTCHSKTPPWERLFNRRAPNGSRFLLMYGFRSIPSCSERTPPPPPPHPPLQFANSALALKEFA